MKTTTTEGKFLLVSKTSGRVIGVTYIGLPKDTGLPVYTKLAENQIELALYDLLLTRLSEESRFFISATLPESASPVGCWVGFSEEFFEGSSPVFCRVAENQGSLNETQIRRLVLHRCSEGGSDGSTSV